MARNAHTLWFLGLERVYMFAVRALYPLAARAVHPIFAPESTEGIFVISTRAGFHPFLTDRYLVLFGDRFSWPGNVPLQRTPFTTLETT